MVTVVARRDPVRVGWGRDPSDGRRRRLAGAVALRVAGGHAEMGRLPAKAGRSVESLESRDGVSRAATPR